MSTGGTGGNGGTVGLFGKTPSQRDFVRVNIGTQVVRDFDEWLRESVMTLPSFRAHLPPEPLPFLFRAPGGHGFLIGLMRGSADGVGREFPLAVFHHLDGDAHAFNWPGLPRAYAGFMAAANELLDRVDSTDPGHLPWLLEQLPVPDAQAVNYAFEQSWLSLAHISADEILDRLFSRPTGNPEGDRWTDDHIYGIGMMLNACYRVAGHPPRAGGGISLDCPVTSDPELVFWLELARRVLRWRSPPSFMWSQRQYRMVLVLGTPGPKLLGVLGTPGTFDEQIWPLIADDEEQVARGARLLTPQQRASIDRPGQSGAMLIDGIAPAI
ncbi:MAG: type VI secretion system-associated protein TagF [Myxococcales bacterium]|nr:type VI secretion system-associated protein TagF [Myxococcales bacterium]